MNTSIKLVVYLPPKACQPLCCWIMTRHVCLLQVLTGPHRKTDVKYGTYNNMQKRSTLTSNCKLNVRTMQKGLSGDLEEVTDPRRTQSFTENSTISLLTMLVYKRLVWLVLAGSKTKIIPFSNKIYKKKKKKRL